jgi:CHAT domain-containing protein
VPSSDRLREVTAGELAMRFEPKPASERHLLYKQLSAIWRRFIRREPSEQPFVHPFFWAAFTFNGV